MINEVPTKTVMVSSVGCDMFVLSKDGVQWGKLWHTAT